MFGLKSNALEYLKQFCAETSIHGLVYIAKKKGFSKLFWTAIFLTMLVLTLRTCAISIVEYYKKEVKSTTGYEIQRGGSQFPAITFCRPHSLSKSKTSGNTDMIFVHSLFMAKEWKDINPAVLKSTKTCRKNVSLAAAPNFTLQVSKTMSLIDFYHLADFDSYNSVLKCWWKNVETECDGLFGNTVLSDGGCFDLFPSYTLNKIFMESDLANSTYGRKLSVVKDWISDSNRPDNAARFLMDAGMHDSCDVSNMYFGAGFRVFINDLKDAFPIDNVLQRVSLMPGYRTDVVIKPTLFDRKTEHLGYCRGGFFPFGNEKVYFKSMCLDVCVFKLLYKECNCRPPFVKGMESYFDRILELNGSKYEECIEMEEGAHLECGKDVMFRAFKSASPQDFCPECIEPCYVTKYNTLLTYRKFPISKELGYYQRLLNSTMNLTEFRKNYLVVDFSFNSNTRLTVVETQAITTEDILITIGNAVGLFMGMSFMSFGELLHLLLEYVVHWSVKFCLFIKLRQNPHKVKSFCTSKQLQKTVLMRTHGQNRSIHKRQQQQRQKKKNAVVVQFA